MNFRIVILTYLASLAVALGCACAGSFQSDKLPHDDRSIRVGFWFGMSNNELLTPEMVEWVGERASFVILNAMEKGVNPYFDYENCAARFKERWPALPVLLYGWAEQGYKTGRVGGLNFDELSASPEWLIRRADGRPYVGRDGGMVSTDITSAVFRHWFARDVADHVARFGTDGVAFDCTLNELRVPAGKSADFFLNGRELEKKYPAGLRELLLDVKKAVEPKYVLFNGLFAKRDGLLERQEQLLEWADGAAVEFFGRNVHVPEGEEKESAPFEDFVLGYLQVMQRHPEKVFLVFGRSPRYVYLGYEEDYRIQRYCLASYLLGMTPLSTFKYHSHFQTSYRLPGRTYGVSYYADWDLDLGVPAGGMEVRDGICLRRFTRGLALVAPMHGPGGAFPLDREYFTPEGERQGGEIALASGTGCLLLTEKPPDPPGRILIDNFEDGRAGEWKFPVNDEDTRVVEEDGNRYVRLVTSTDAVKPHHERRIQPVRSLIPYDRISFRIRTSDRQGAVLVRVEVSDGFPTPPLWERRDRRNRPLAKGETRKPYVVLVVPPKDGEKSFSPEESDIPFGQWSSPGPGRVPYLVITSRAYPSDGRWETVDLNIRKFLTENAPRFTPHRIPSIRVLGNADLDDIVIYRGGQ